MPLKHDRMWMFWSMLLLTMGIVLLNITFNLETYRPGEVRAAETAVDSARKKELERFVDFTKKTACHQNIQVIETLVEMWYIQHGYWPKSDMSDIGHDIDYFPKGVPRCPVDGKPYILDPVTHRIMGHDHGEADNPMDMNPDNETQQSN